MTTLMTALAAGLLATAATAGPAPLGGATDAAPVDAARLVKKDESPAGPALWSEIAGITTLSATPGKDAGAFGAKLKF